MTGTELDTFCEELNGGASIGSSVLFQFINLAKAIVEQMRPWMLLRYTDTSATVVAGNTWQTAIDLSGIERFNRFYGDTPIKLFDGANGIQYFKQVPFDKRLETAMCPARSSTTRRPRGCTSTARSSSPARSTSTISRGIVYLTSTTFQQGNTDLIERSNVRPNGVFRRPGFATPSRRTISTS
jgi:hypothetical protein